MNRRRALRAVAISIMALALAGCTSTMNLTPKAGAMSAHGTIQPCEGNGRDSQACGNAIFNSGVIAGVRSGQTPAEVRTIMGHAAERREYAGGIESWGYITSYKDKMLTWITFTDQKVSSLSHEVWERD